MKGRLNLWLAVIVVVAVLSWGFGGRLVGDAGDPAGDPAAEVRQPATGKDIAAVEPVDPPHVVVLNGTEQAGLGREFGLRLAAIGCVVDEVGNAPHGRFASTLLVNRRLAEEVAADLAARLGGVPVVREFDTRTTADAVVVLGADAERVAAHLDAARP